MISFHAPLWIIHVENGPPIWPTLLRRIETKENAMWAGMLIQKTFQNQPTDSQWGLFLWYWAHLIVISLFLLSFMHDKDQGCEFLNHSERSVSTTLYQNNLLTNPVVLRSCQILQYFFMNNWTGHTIYGESKDVIFKNFSESTNWLCSEDYSCGTELSPCNHFHHPPLCR
jgi:hypothetical protein